MSAHRCEQKAGRTVVTCTLTGNFPGQSCGSALLLELAAKRLPLWRSFPELSGCSYGNFAKCFSIAFTSPWDRCLSLRCGCAGNDLERGEVIGLCWRSDALRQREDLEIQEMVPVELLVKVITSAPSFLIARSPRGPPPPAPCGSNSLIDMAPSPSVHSERFRGRSAFTQSMVRCLHSPS